MKNTFLDDLFRMAKIILLPAFYLSIIIIFHICCFIIISNVATPEKFEKCPSAKTYNSKILMMLFNTLFMILNFWTGIINMNISYAILRKEPFKIPHGCDDLAVGTIWFAVLMNIIPILIFRPCFCNNYKEEFHKLLFTIIMAHFFMFFNTLFYLYCSTTGRPREKIEKFYTSLSDFYQKIPIKYRKIFTIFLLSGLIISTVFFRRENNNIWTNIIFGVGFFNTLLNIYFIMLEKQATIEIEFLTTLSFFSVLLSINFSNDSISNNNIIALLFANIHLISLSIFFSIIDILPCILYFLLWIISIAISLVSCYTSEHYSPCEVMEGFENMYENAIIPFFTYFYNIIFSSDEQSNETSQQIANINQSNDLINNTNMTHPTAPPIQNNEIIASSIIFVDAVVQTPNIIHSGEMMGHVNANRALAIANLV